MFCSNCGNKLENTDEFCPYCGMNQRQENIQQRNVTTQKRKIPLYEKIGVVFGFCMFVFILNLILSDALSSDNKETLEKLKDFTVFENESSEKIEVYSFKYGDEWKLRYVDDGINVKIKEPKLTEIFCTVLGEEKTSSFDGTFFYLIHEGDLNMFFDPELDEEHIEAITYNLDSDEYEILADGKHYSVKKEFEDLLNENQFKEILKGDVDAFIDVLEKNGLKIKDIEDISCLDIRNMEWDTQEDINEDEKSQETRDINEESVDISTFKSKDKNELESYNIDEISEISTYAFPGGHMILGRIDVNSILPNVTATYDTEKLRNTPDNAALQERQLYVTIWGTLQSAGNAPLIEMEHICMGGSENDKGSARLISNGEWPDSSEMPIKCIGIVRSREVWKYMDETQPKEDLLAYYADEGGSDDGKMGYLSWGMEEYQNIGIGCNWEQFGESSIIDMTTIASFANTPVAIYGRMVIGGGISINFIEPLPKNQWSDEIKTMMEITDWVVSNSSEYIRNQLIEELGLVPNGEGGYSLPSSEEY